MLNVYLRYYIPITVAYGAVRKTIQVKDATIQHYDRRKSTYVHIPMLLTDKICLVAYSAMFSMYVWPIFVVQDFKKAELKLRNLKPEWYDINEKQYVGDYLLS